jgi:hypothetical protein
VGWPEIIEEGLKDAVQDGGVEPFAVMVTSEEQVLYPPLVLCTQETHFSVV